MSDKKQVVVKAVVVVICIAAFIFAAEGYR